MSNKLHLKQNETVTRSNLEFILYDLCQGGSGGVVAAWDRADVVGDSYRVYEFSNGQVAFLKVSLEDKLNDDLFGTIEKIAKSAPVFENREKAIEAIENDPTYREWSMFVYDLKEKKL